MVQSLSFGQTSETLCKLMNKWGIHLKYLTGAYETSESVNQYDFRTVLKSVPFLTEEQAMDLVVEQNLWVFVDSEKEAFGLYDQIYGDETEPQDDNKISVSATLYSSSGECITENS